MLVQNTSTGVFSYQEIRIITLKVEIGQPNEWNKYDSDGSGWLLGDCYVEYDENNNLFCELIISSTMSSSHNLYTWTKDFTETLFDLKTIATFEFHPYIDSNNYKNQSVFINKNEVYFVQNNQRWGISDSANKKYIGLYYYNISTNVLNTIYEKYLGEFAFSNLEAIYINTNQNKLYIQYNTNINSDNNIADYYYQRYEGEWKPLEIGLKKNFILRHRAIYITNVYNMLQIYMYPVNLRPTTWQLYSILEIYNPNNYNGESYTNINSMVPQSGILYDDNKNIIFARNLYNKTVNDRVMQATVEIPNNYLNDKIIAKQDLISETNSIMVSRSNMITKNVYETVYLNFINTLQMINNNNLANQTLNPVGATRLNESISEVQDYANQKISKVRVDYTDGSVNVFTVTLAKIDNAYRATISIYIKSELFLITFISEDENTDYCSIYPGIDFDFETGKTYTINQDITVEGIQF